MRRPIRQKRSVVEYLTTLSSALDRLGCHTPYICPDAGRFEAWFELASAIPTCPPFCVVPLFRCSVGWFFVVCRNNLAIPWLAPHQQANISARGRWNGLRCCGCKTN